MIYTEILISSLGSLAYAEDDGKHILGIKTVQPMTMSGVSIGRDTPMASELEERDSRHYCCHVFECGNEASDLTALKLTFCPVNNYLDNVLHRRLFVRSVQ